MKTLFAGVALAALIQPVSAFAQTTTQAQPAEEQALPADPAVEEDQSGDEGNAIVVTALKRERTLQDTPVAVSVTTAETLERAQIRDLNDLQTLVPALRVTQLQSSANTNFIIRGFGNGANNAGIEPSVGVFVDGVYRSRTAAQIGDLPDVQRIEVLRGPQSTLFGKNASAGVISIITREPRFTFGGSAEVSYGNNDAIVAKGYVTGGLTDTIAASLAGGINRRDGFITDLGYNGEANTRDRWFARAQMLFEPSDALKVRLIGDYDKIDEVCCAVVNLRRSAATGAVNILGGQVNDAATPFADVVYSNFPSTNDIENYGLSGQIDFEFGPLTLTSISAYRESHALTNQDSDFTSANLIGANTGDTDIDTFTQELRVSGSVLDKVSFVLGGYFFDENVRTRNSLTYGTQFRPYVDLLSAGGVAQIESLILNVPVGTFQRPGQGLSDDFQMGNTAYSAFGNIDFEIVDGLTLTLGANYTSDRKTVTSNSVSTDAFSALNLVAIGNGVIRNTVVAQQVGAALNLGASANATQIGTFANAQPAIYAAIVGGASAFATANQSNPAVNPLLALRPLQFLPPFLNFPNAVEDGKTRDSDWSYTARLAFEATDTVNIYASYATGFKASSFNLSRDSRPLASHLTALTNAGLVPPNLTTGSRFAGPEDAEVFELGVKADWRIVSANLTVFKQIIRGFQSNVFTGTGFALANAGKQSTFGIEFDGTARPTDELTVNLSMIYLAPKYDSFLNSALGDATGQTPAGTPGISATFGLQWSKELGNGDRLTLRGDYHYESQVQIIEGLPGFIQRNAVGQVISYQPAFDAARPLTREVDDMNASLTYALNNGLELSVWGRNLLNDRYLLSVFDSVAQTGSISGYPNQPRTYGVSARFKW